MLPKRRQIVENGVDQVDLVEVPLPETKKRKKWAGRFFSNKVNGAINVDL
jgi:hypothetical protein